MRKEMRRQMRDAHNPLILAIIHAAEETTTGTIFKISLNQSKVLSSLLKFKV